MEESTIKQIMGFILIVMVIVLNLVLSLNCIKYGGCEILDSYSWGFTNAIIIMVGMINLGG